ncbi:uncharacterized protein ASPGLDRAFT_53695 [Aspergillus glaucus CBS 516.65]|uniref:Uncharacterized protein n=1 Tax=Aspergillus glaucus CBS 516.65 TaxID=1160497 RepID=A0A1L9VYG0_ASPGL|nr:hypothetical protein ASPGLDRAFT_53695 [Aspergillus glaucus CBS 516.65]OJJ88963.1 hypothetical protein ASPGLDRAFT_53695 [Aspergillus glaucus CBS 516.65]
MVQIKANMLLILLAGTALAMPAKTPANNAASPGKTVQCTTDGKKIKIPENIAKDIAKKAPSGSQFVEDECTEKPEFSTFSSYPHQYHNGDPFDWDNHVCNSENVALLEFPIKDDNPAEMYPWKGMPRGDGKKPEKMKNIPCRVVYSATDGHYCGVMCHNSMEEGGEKGFHKCT